MHLGLSFFQFMLLFSDVGYSLTLIISFAVLKKSHNNDSTKMYGMLYMECFIGDCKSLLEGNICLGELLKYTFCESSTNENEGNARHTKAWAGDSSSRYYVAALGIRLELLLTMTLDPCRWITLKR